MNTNRYHRAVLVFVTVFCLLTAGAYGQQAGKRGKKEFTFKGIVESVDANAKWVTVTSENIPGWLNSVKSTYKVDNPEVLKTVQPGDRVTAKVYEGDFKVLYELRIIPPEDTPLSLGKKRIPQ
jgi:Copper binding periplasmic protein CusF